MEKKEEDKKEEDKKVEDKKEEVQKGGILSKKEKNKKKRKSVNWDVKNLENNELENKLHPVTMKITEPKTPYTPYEEGDDEYFNKLNEVNKTKPTADVLAQVINTLEKENQDNEFIEVEVVEKDGTISNAKISRFHTNHEISEVRKHELKDAAIKFYSNMPKHVPAKKNGQPVRYEFTTGGDFKI